MASSRTVFSNDFDDRRQRKIAVNLQRTYDLNRKFSNYNSLRRTSNGKSRRVFASSRKCHQVIATTSVRRATVNRTWHFKCQDIYVSSHFQRS